MFEHALKAPVLNFLHARSQPRSQGSLLPAVGRVGKNPGNEIGKISERMSVACVQKSTISFVARGKGNRRSLNAGKNK